MLYLVVVVFSLKCLNFGPIFDMHILDGNEKWYSVRVSHSVCVCVCVGGGGEGGMGVGGGGMGGAPIP